MAAVTKTTRHPRDSDPTHVMLWAGRAPKLRFCGLTFEISRTQRQDAPAAWCNITIGAARPVWRAVASRLDRGVRPHRARNDLALHRDVNYAQPIATVGRRWYCQTVSADYCGALAVPVARWVTAEPGSRSEVGEIALSILAHSQSPRLAGEDKRCATLPLLRSKGVIHCRSTLRDLGLEVLPYPSY
jgi:hypothetical protein